MDKTLNKKLSRQRELKGWSQEKLAQEVGTTAKIVGRWERGESKPTPYYRQKLIQIFGKNAEELGFLDKENVKKAADTFQREPASKQAHDQPQVSTHTDSPRNDIIHAEQEKSSHREAVLEAKEDAPSTLIRLTPEQVASLLQLIALGDTTMACFDPKRRAALLHLLSAVSMLTVIPQALIDPELWERLNASVDEPSNIDTATLDHFEMLTTTCWELSNGDQLQVAERVLPGFLPSLMQLAPYHPKAASLVAQGFRLQSILVAHQLKLVNKVSLCEQGVIYARQSDDYDILVAALIELTVAYRYTQRYEDALRASQEALYYSRHVSPLLQSRAYIAAAETLSRYGRTKEANFYIQLAYETFPDHSEHDPIVHANPNILIWGLYEGMVYLNQGDGKRALNTFEGKLFDGRLNAYRSARVLPERIRLEIVNHQGRAAILSNDLEAYVHYLEESVAGALALKSKKRYDEAITIFRQDVPQTWLKDPRIKDISERYHLIA